MQDETREIFEEPLPRTWERLRGTHWDRANQDAPMLATKGYQDVQEALRVKIALEEIDQTKALVHATEELVKTTAGQAEYSNRLVNATRGLIWATGALAIFALVQLIIEFLPRG